MTTQNTTLLIVCAAIALLSSISANADTAQAPVRVTANSVHEEPGTKVDLVFDEDDKGGKDHPKHSQHMQVNLRRGQPYMLSIKGSRSDGQHVLNQDALKLNLSRFIQLDPNHSHGSLVTVSVGY